jgi:hypothetical protein
VYLLKAAEILHAEGDAVGERAARSADERAKKAHEALYPGLMDWARVRNTTTENLR